MKISLTSCAFALSLLLAVASIAGPPVTMVSEFTVTNEPMANCGDFLIIANGAGKNRLTIFSDRNGDPTRLTFQGRYNGTMTNSVTGFSLADAPSVANIFVDLLDDTQTNVGAFFTVTVPGGGTVLIEAGRLILDENGQPTFIAGPHRPTDDTIDILCNALG